MISKLLDLRTSTISQGAFLLAFSALLSSVLGVARDRLLASGFGAGPELDVYFAAFRIPDFLYNLLILGGVSAVFLPLFAEYMERNSKEAWRFVNNLLHIVAVTMGVFALVVAVLTPLIVELAVPGFGAQQKELMTSLVRLMLLSPILFGISSVFSGVLQYNSRFLWYALAPVVYNLGIIGGIVFLAPSLGIFGVGIGVVVGAGLHALIQVPSVLRSGFSWKPVFDIKDPGIRKAFRLALPRTIGGAAYHFNLVFMTAFASLFATGSLTAFTFADRFQQVPFGFIAVPFALSAFPVLSRFAAAKDKHQFTASLLGALRKIGLLALPVSLFLFFFRAPLVELILYKGKFTIEDVQLTSSLLGIFALGIVFQSFIPLLIRAFYSLQDTKTPTFISVATIAFNILLALFLTSRGEGIAVLPLSIVLSGILQFVLLLLLLRAKITSSFKSI
ncbi:MAG: murein biosynthesis integral membrane protein MurJ [Candidatus Wildermuthbacteria bacterium]|nr:murein biosynthesis integral membrane protein MurJ [Candidatus Wildermuthbacteria bacterium]